MAGNNGLKGIGVWIAWIVLNAVGILVATIILSFILSFASLSNPVESITSITNKVLMTVTMFAYGAMAWFVIGSVLAVCQLLVLRSLLPKSYQWLVVTIAAMSVAGAINMAKNEPKSWPTWLKHKRYRIETVIGQLVERFQAKRVWARDAWHFWSRWLRRILNHTFAVYLCQQNDLSSLRFTDLIVD